MPGNVDLAPGVDLAQMAREGKKEGQFIYGVKPCIGQRNATTGKYNLLAVSTAYGCTEPYFLIRRDLPAPHRDDPLRRVPPAVFWQVDVNFAKTTPITDKIRLPGASRSVQPLQQPEYDERRYNHERPRADFGRINRNSTAPVELPAVRPAGIPVDLLVVSWDSGGEGLPESAFPRREPADCRRPPAASSARSRSPSRSARRRPAAPVSPGHIRWADLPAPIQQRVRAAGIDESRSKLSVRITSAARRRASSKGISTRSSTTRCSRRPSPSRRRSSRR